MDTNLEGTMEQTDVRREEEGVCQHCQWELPDQAGRTTVALLSLEGTILSLRLENGFLILEIHYCYIHYLVSPVIGVQCILLFVVGLGARSYEFEVLQVSSSPLLAPGTITKVVITKVVLLLLSLR